MQIDLLSFGFGVVVTLAMVIVLDRLYPLLGGSRRARRLAREVRRLEAIIRRKDQLIRKSIEELKKEKELLDEGEG